MITAGPVIMVGFLVAVSLIWVMIVYQIIMTVAGFVHRVRSARLTAALLRDGGPLPPVSILIPARNEEVVIERTLEAMRQLTYPGALWRSSLSTTVQRMAPPISCGPPLSTTGASSSSRCRCRSRAEASPTP